MTRTAVGRRARRGTRGLPTDAMPEVGLPHDRTSDLELADSVRRALTDLPAAQRAVVVLRYFEDCSEVETARGLGWSGGTVKRRASRAFAALRAGGLLAEEGVR